MKKVLSLVVIAVILVAGTFLLTGCGDSESGGGTSGGGSTGGKSWPTGISYVPNIPYDGKGKIVNTEEKVSDYGDTSYSIYIDGADLESTNKYVDKLYSNGYSVLYSFASEGQYLKQPEKDNFYTMQYVNSDTGFRTDATIIVGITLHDNEEGYNLVITFGDLSSYNE